MSTLDRYKKKGGFLQLLNLIETTGTEKREKFFKMIAEENQAWEVELKKKMLTLDRICSWNASYLMEIFPKVPHQNLAAIVSGSAPERQQLLLSAMPFSDRRKVEMLIAEKKSSTGEINGSVTRLMTEIRAMVQNGTLKFEKFDQELVVPEDIEDLLSSGKTLISNKEIEAAFGSSASVVQGFGSSAASEELTHLRRRMMQLAQENQKLLTENMTLKEKLEQIRKIA